MDLYTIWWGGEHSGGLRAAILAEDGYHLKASDEDIRPILGTDRDIRACFDEEAGCYHI